MKKLGQYKKRYYAVCITKADKIYDGIYRSPEGINTALFGEEMIKALQIPDMGGEEYSLHPPSASSLTAISLQRRPNFDASSDLLNNISKWKPHGVEFPFFWAFEKKEVTFLQEVLSKNWYKKINKSTQLRKYIPYPKEEFIEPKDDTE